MGANAMMREERAAIRCRPGISGPGMPRAESRSHRFAGLYDAPTAAYWRTRYVPSLRWNLDRLVLARLTDDEQRAVTGVCAQFPLRHDADPFAYYAAGDPPVITISVCTIRFLDDLSTAIAWLDRHGCPIDPVARYASVLKYRRATDFANGRYPLPLPALGIPDDVLLDAAVDQAAQRMLKSAVIFLFAHELGHIIHRQAASPSPLALGDRHDHELAADRFAIDLFRRIGLVPEGLVPLFIAAAYLAPLRVDFPTETLWMEHLRSEALHPLTGHRLRAIALELSRSPEAFAALEPRRTRAVQRVRATADRVASIAPLLDDPDLQRYVAALGRRLPLADLRVRGG